MEQNINHQHTASYQQLYGMFRAAAQSIDQRISGYTAAQRAIQQLAVMYLLPSYQPGTTYPEGAIVRVAGKVYQTLQETSDSPVTFIGDGGAMEANDQWQVLIDHDVNDGNWAQLDLDYLVNNASLPERLELALYKMQEWDAKISQDYGEWKAEQSELFQQQLQQQLLDLEAAYADRFNEAEQTIAEQQRINAALNATILEQRQMLQRQADLLDEFARTRFIVDNYTPKE